MAVCTAHGFELYLAGSTVLRGWALALQGHVVEGTAQILQGLAAWRVTGAEQSRPYFLALLAEVHGHAGQYEQGLTVLTEAFTQIEATDERFYEAELYRLQGDLLLSQSSDYSVEAEACFQQALTIARRQQAKPWELRVAMSLARLWQCQDKRSDAYKLLVPIYSWFTEGFDTADLQEARRLLETLA